jgi:hypothetical protein
VALPALIRLSKNNMDWVDESFTWHVLAGIALLCGLVAGSYPAFYLSSFKPVQVLKSLKQKSGSAAWIRKGLVVTQFTFPLF